MVAVPCNRVEENYLASTDKLTLDKTILVKKYTSYTELYIVSPL